MLYVLAEHGKILGHIGDGQNTDPQSMDYPYGLPKWTTLNNGLSLKILLQ